MPDMRTHERLLEWGEVLKREGNRLGDSLVGYATAWRAEVERLRSELADTRDAVKLIYGRNTNMVWPSVSDETVDSYVQFLRDQKRGGAAKAAGGKRGD